MVVSDPIYLFPVDDAYLFRRYFARTDIFDALREYYDDYRFAVPTGDYPEVRDLLEDNHYRPIIVEDIDAFAVLKEEYTDHAGILRKSVIHYNRDGYNFFVMQSPAAVEDAVERGATRLAETDKVLGI